MKNEQEKKERNLLAVYNDPSASGSLGGSQRFATAQGIVVKNAPPLLERDLGYSLDKPRRKRFKTLPVMVEGLDHLWVADLALCRSITEVTDTFCR